MPTKRLTSLMIVCAAAFSLLASAALREDLPPDQRRAAMKNLLKEGNFREAYDGFRELALDPSSDPETVGGDLREAIQCLTRLNRTHEVDDFREAAIEAHAGNWRLLHAAAETYLSVAHHGYEIAGEFRRGHHRGGGKRVNSSERDRARALQLLHQAVRSLPADTPKEPAFLLHRSLAAALLHGRDAGEAWRLGYLSDLDSLPDTEETWNWYARRDSGAPVDEEGQPLVHALPESWEAARTDGERWRWALLQQLETLPGRRGEVLYGFARFLHGQFGVQTMGRYRHVLAARSSKTSEASEAEERDESGTWELHTLADDETIARLATGIRRFRLPDEFSPIKVFRQVVDSGSGYGPAAMERLAIIFENRRQYPKAADAWRQSIEKYGESEARKRRLEQIVGNWGRFESGMTQPAGEGATVEFRHRNGEAVTFRAHEIRVKTLLDDVKAYVKSKPERLDWNRVNIGNIGHRLVGLNETKYVGELVATWKLDLDPREKHFDRRISVTTPLQKAGAYLLTAEMKDGNTSKIVVWLSDTSIVRKPLDGEVYYFVADAVTGRPVARANLELFGYQRRRVSRGRYEVFTRNFAEFTDADGQVFLDVDRTRGYQWIATATTRDGRFAHLGFSSVWHRSYHDTAYQQVRAFTITDRPAYRPGQTVHFKSWVRESKYDKDDTSRFAGNTFPVAIHDAKGEKVFSADLTADDHGGLEAEYVLPEGAALGVYRLNVDDHGGITFRVEEYKKPEFEVTVEAPEEPVRLGEKIAATVRATYYFGSPVTDARVKYKVLRSAHEDRWFPRGDWDWLYGRGYWWFSHDYAWYPGWSEWGCKRPWPWWWPRNSTPPEVVAEGETAIGADGTVKLEIDTALARALHPDQDHRYEITAEVTDRSRRTIVGRGRVLAARRPFQVVVWVDRGYYHVGDTVRASFSARTLDGRPVPGKGEARLYSVRYREGSQPEESEVGRWEVETDVQGLARWQLKASEKGQYRLAARVTDGAGHTIEGGYVFTVMGDALDGSEFRFNDVELVPDKKEYRPGETVKLQVNAERRDATVLLFARPSNGVYLRPRVLRLRGKSAVIDVPVVTRDMPNFFVEALTVSGGGVHSETREIHVPPRKRILSLDVLPSAEQYLPGEKATVKLKIRDVDGGPFVGSTVVAIYDKSVEYIAGGSNVPDIRKFFWSWRRRHSSYTESNLDRRSGNLTLPRRPAMADVGMFGATAVDELATSWFSRAGKVKADGQLLAASALAKPGEILPESTDGAAAGKGGAGGAAELVQPTVRREFADTALWVGSLTTAADGTAEVELEMPENLTAWRIKVWGMGHGTRVGQGEAEVVTRKNLILRLQAPRFFVEKDEVVLSANVHNYLASAKQVRVSLELDGSALEPLGESSRTVEVAADGETRVDWRVRAAREGEAVVRMLALTDEESDAVEMRFPVHVHGMLKTDSFSGAIRPDEDLGRLTFRVPDERRINQSRLEVRYSPTLAGAMVDALPYLADYPHGCTEQTLNRFLPTVITQRLLREMGLDLAAIREKRTNLNAQEIGDDVARAAGWRRFDRNPVFDEKEVEKMAREGVKALTEMQLPDGGWGWFSGWGARSFPHTTAVVVRGLGIAARSDVALVPGVLEKGIAWLERYQKEQVQRLANAPSETKPYKVRADNLDALVFAVLVEAERPDRGMLEYLYRDRTHLAVYSLAILGVALHDLEEEEKLAMVVRNVEQYLVEDDENQTAYLNLPGGYWWYWYGSEYEAHAYTLKLLARTDPTGRTASRLAKYLVNNRKHGTYWNSTRDTALCVEALAEYLKASGEDRPDLVVEVWLDGEKQKEVKITQENLFAFDNKFVLFGDAVESGEHTLEIRRRGRGPLYFNAYLTNFTLEDPIERAGLELRVNRKYYKLVQVEEEVPAAGSRGQPARQRVETYERIPLENLATLESGDLVEVELEVESKNDTEYVILEDRKAAGFEPVELRSGYDSSSLGAYREFRDDRVAFFIRRLARGRHSVSYRLRAEIPGRFSALPARAHAMYAPELRGNSDEIRLGITD